MGGVLHSRSNYAPEDFTHPAMGFDEDRRPILSASSRSNPVYQDEPVRVKAAPAARPAASFVSLPGTVQSAEPEGSDREAFGAKQEEPLQPPQQPRPAPKQKAQKAALREAEEAAALAAVRAALPQTGQGRGGREVGRPVAGDRVAKEGQAGGKKVRMAEDQRPAANLPWVEVDMSARRVLLFWVQRARRSLKARPQRRRGGTSRGSRKQREAKRIQQVISIFMDNEEELERMCYEDPARLITAQIELLTQRITALTSGHGGSTSVTAANKAGPKAAATGGRFARAAAAPTLGGAVAGRGPVGARIALQQPAKEEAEEERTSEVVVPESWEQVFDRAMQNRKDWKNKRGEGSSTVRPSGPLVSAVKPPPNPSNDIAAQLKAERARLAAILPRFEQQQRRQRRQEDPGEQLLTELLADQRKAMDDKGRELREERRRREAEARAEEERRRQEVEAEQRRLDMLAKEAAERKKREAREEAERRRRQAEAEAEQRRLDALAQEAERQRVQAEKRQRQAEAEAERRRRQAEAEARATRQRQAEEEAERLRLAALAQEAERLREEAARRQKEAEEEAERQRRQAEAEAAERLRKEEQARLEAEAEQARRKALEKLQKAEAARKQAEEERLAQEEQRQRQAQQQLLSAGQRLSEAPPKKVDRRLAAFDVLEGGSPPEPAAPAAPPPQQPLTRKKSAGPDFLARAMAALGDGEDEESSDSSSGSGTEDNSAGMAASADADLLKLSGAIIKRIDDFHAA